MQFLQRKWQAESDLRHLTTVTIDGRGCQSLDDATTLYEEDGLYKLGVHIADVTELCKGKFTS